MTSRSGGRLSLARIRHLRCQLYSGYHAARIRRSLARDVERGSMVWGRSHNRKSERHVDAFPERERLYGDERLIVIHAERYIESCPRLGMKHRIGRKGPKDVCA